MSHRYFTLAIRQPDRCYFGIEFGDYDRSVVQDELQYYLDQGFPRSALKIVSSRDDQASINAAVAALNA